MNGGYEYPREVIRTCAGIIIDVIDVSKPSATTYNAAGLRERVRRGFDFVIKTCKVNRLPDDAALEILYPLAALADETLLNIPECRGLWSEEPLQLRYFGEIAAGTKFFAKLDSLVSCVSMDDVITNCADWKIDVLELYFLSLAAGFKGMYYSENSHVLRNIFENLGIILTDIRLKSKSTPLDKNKKSYSCSKLIIYTISASLFALVAAAAAYVAASAGLSEFLGNF